MMAIVECKSRRANRERKRLARENRAFERLKNKVIHLAPNGRRKNKLLVLRLAIQRIKDLLKQLEPGATIPQFIKVPRGSYESDEDEEGGRMKIRRGRRYHYKNGKKLYVEDVRRYEHPPDCRCGSTSTDLSSPDVYSPKSLDQSEHYSNHGHYNDYSSPHGDGDDDGYQPQSLQNVGSVPEGGQEPKVEESSTHYFSM